MTDMAEKSDLAKSADTRSTWSYVSGRVSVMETWLLPRVFFEGLIRNRGLSEARSMLAKTQYRQYFNTDESVLNYSSTIDTAVETIIADIFKDAPAHGMLAFFDAPGRYLEFRSLFRRLCNRQASLADFEASFDILVSERESRCVEKHIALLKTKEAPQNADPVARSLFLDSALCSLRLSLASSIPEIPVRSVLVSMAALECWSAVLRARWNGTSAEVVQRWFVLPDNFASLALLAASLADTNPIPALSGIVPETVLARIRGENIQSLRQSIDMIVREAIHDEVIALRMSTYGPEKILAYIISLRTEADNLRLALASIVSGIESKTVAERFRREYA